TVLTVSEHPAFSVSVYQGGVVGCGDSMLKVRRPRAAIVLVVSSVLGIAVLGIALWRSGVLLAPPRPNVVIVLIDTLRADHMSLYGYARDTTPELQRIARQGLVLRSHFANAPWTKPSVASIITGLHP